MSKLVRINILISSLPLPPNSVFIVILYHNFLLLDSFQAEVPDNSTQLCLSPNNLGVSGYIQFSVSEMKMALDCAS